MNTSSLPLVDWAKTMINLYDDAGNDVIETIVQTPWSRVLKISTSQGPFYLKQTPTDLFIEVDVIQTCHDLCDIKAIPEIIAANKHLHCFLMKSCGDVSLRTLFDGQLQVALLIQGLKIYKTLQQATVPHVDAFIQLGVPDWQLDQFPRLYQLLVSDEDFLKLSGLKVEQIKILQHSEKNLSILCHELSNYQVTECLNHSDFHENNMLYDKATQKINIIDLGETAICHPFFSLAAFMKTLSDRYHISVDSSDYQVLHDACFQGWLLSGEDLRRALGFIETLLPIYWILAHQRLVNATCPVALGNIPRMNHRVKDAFLWFIKNMQSPR